MNDSRLQPTRRCLPQIDLRWHHAQMKINYLLLFSLLCSSWVVNAWGTHSHEMVAEIAARHLQPETRKVIEELLGDRADLAMRDVASWADTIRDQPRYRSTSPLHYVNFPRNQCSYSAQRLCANGRCVVDAILKHAKALADTRRSRTERAEDLAFLIHYVGDVHQPLHAGWREDRGGNDFQIQVGRKGSNLHALWDDTLARRAGLSVAKYADRLDAAAAVRSDTSWSTRAPSLWAEESCRLVMDHVYPESGRVSRDYLDRSVPIVEARIRIAGLRLAALLDSVLAQWH